jgi:RNase P/RNase MRP subunit p30
MTPSTDKSTKEIRDSHFVMSDLVWLFGTKAFRYYECWDNLPTDGSLAVWHMDKEEKKAAMHEAHDNVLKHLVKNYTRRKR